MSKRLLAIAAAGAATILTLSSCGGSGSGGGTPNAAPTDKVLHLSFLQDPGQVIDDKTVRISEHPGLHPGHFPPGQVAVESIEERPVVAHPGGEGTEQVGGPERDLDIQVYRSGS